MSEIVATELEPPDTHYLAAAEGWLELGAPEEAFNELNQLSPTARDHPDGLHLLWATHAANEDWQAALDVSEQLVTSAPDVSAGWIHRAYATRRQTGGSLETAWLALYPAAKLFPKEPIIPYNLACYACQMGRLQESKAWLNRALRIPADKSEKAMIKKMALADSDLEVLWGEIEKL